MTKPKFTPGEWETHLGLDYFSISNESGSVVVPEVRCNPENKRDVADAYLISASPNLYKACQRAKKLLEPEVTKEPDRTIFWELVAAIRKADGEETK